MKRSAMAITLLLAVGCGSNEDPAPGPPQAPEGAAAPAEGPEDPEPEPVPTESADGVAIVGPLVLGEAAEVTVPPIAGTEGQRDFLLAIAAPHGVRCDAHAEHEGEGRDAQMALLRDDTRLAQNSDAGEGFDARLDFDAEPGTYAVRVWEWLHRDATLTVTCTRRAVDSDPPDA